MSPRLVLPEDLKKEVYVLDYDLPDESEILFLLGHLGKRYFGEKGLSDADAKKLAMALKGLTQDETEHVVSQVFSRRPVFDEAGLLRGSRREGAGDPQGRRPRVRAAAFLARGHRGASRTSRNGS